MILFPGVCSIILIDKPLAQCNADAAAKPRQPFEQKHQQDNLKSADRPVFHGAGRYFGTSAALT